MQYIEGKEHGVRLESRILEERIQQAVREGADTLTVRVCGQHGLGGRLQASLKKPLNLRIEGSPGQRLGSCGFPRTRIEVMGPCSDDTGWLNAGAEIIVHGNAGNGTANAMAQGKVFVAGSVGARSMTMTKENPRFPAPELWVLGGAGDSFAEFMAGGIAVLCGSGSKEPSLGYRPCVGMVGGRIFYQGPKQEISAPDALHVPLTDTDWAWLSTHMQEFLAHIGRQEIFQEMHVRENWHLVRAKTPQEKLSRRRKSMQEFHTQTWDKELGHGGLVGDLTSTDRSHIGLLPTGRLRRFMPVWENRKYAAPCEASCPSGIPVQKRWELIRQGKTQEAVELVLGFSPFPGTVCGHLCPNPCMHACTKNLGQLVPIDAKALGRAASTAKVPDLPPLSGKSVAIFGGGPAGISAAWQLRMLGHKATIFDQEEELGGKILASIPDSRIPAEVLTTEIARARKVIAHVQLQKTVDKEGLEHFKKEYDFLILATGAHKPRTLPVPGNERLLTALSFLKASKKGRATAGERVVIIGAGNVGCDVAAEAARLGSKEITLIDVQKPAAFGKEREEAERVGAQFLWPAFTQAITAEGVLLTDGRLLRADTVIVSIGDVPDIELPDSVATERGFVVVNDDRQTTDPQIFAIGDLVRPGLITQAIGDGRAAAQCIHELLSGKRPQTNSEDLLESQGHLLANRDTTSMGAETIDYARMNLRYFDPRQQSFESLEHCATECSSCGSCRDCGICESICPRGAISRQEHPELAMVCNEALCIACGFCARACPCGIWAMHQNSPLLETE